MNVVIVRQNVSRSVSSSARQSVALGPAASSQEVPYEYCTARSVAEAVNGILPYFTRFARLDARTNWRRARDRVPARYRTFGSRQCQLLRCPALPGMLDIEPNGLCELTAGCGCISGCSRVVGKSAMSVGQGDHQLSCRPANLTVRCQPGHVDTIVCIVCIQFNIFDTLIVAISSPRSGTAAPTIEKICNFSSIWIFLAPAPCRHPRHTWGTETVPPIYTHLQRFSAPTPPMGG